MAFGSVLVGITTFAGPAAAHASALFGPEGFWQAWSFAPLSLGLILGAIWLYGRGLARLRHLRGRLPLGLGRAPVAAFVAGELSLLAALVSPLDALAGILLSAHMVQHVILVVVAPILLLLGRPEIAWLHGLPRTWRRALARGTARRLFSGLSVLVQPIPAALLHSATLWIWHAPALFNAAVQRDWLHWIEHATFFGTALLFWRAVLRASQVRALALAGMAACLIVMVLSGFLGALLSFAPAPLYRSSGSELWGLTALADQQLAGVIMWVPMGLTYLCAGLVVAGRLLTEAGPPIEASPAAGASFGGNTEPAPAATVAVSARPDPSPP